MVKVFNIVDLSDRHHVLKSVADGFSEAAGVCFERHHQSPLKIGCEWNDSSHAAQVSWPSPSALAKSTFANDEEATRDGAYAVSFAAAEEMEGLVVATRAEKLTGADWYVIPKDAQLD